jgi:hypothetical protein
MTDHACCRDGPDKLHLDHETSKAGGSSIPHGSLVSLPPSMSSRNERVQKLVRARRRPAGGSGRGEAVVSVHIVFRPHREHARGSASKMRLSNGARIAERSPVRQTAEVAGMALTRHGCGCSMESGYQSCSDCTDTAKLPLHISRKVCYGPVRLRPVRETSCEGTPMVCNAAAER